MWSSIFRYNPHTNDGILCAAVGSPLRNSTFVALCSSPATLSLISLATTILFTAFWSIAPPATAEILWLLYVHVPSLDLFKTAWYRPLKVYGLIASAFVLIRVVQSVLVFAWGVGVKWCVLGRRRNDEETWDAVAHGKAYFVYGKSCGLFIFFVQSNVVCSIQSCRVFCTGGTPVTECWNISQGRRTSSGMSFFFVPIL